MAKYKVVFAKFPGKFSEHPDSSGWMTETLLKVAKDPQIEAIPWRKSDTPIPMVRNLCVQHALQVNADYLLMIDSDMAPDYERLMGDPKAKPFWESSWAFMLAHRDTPCAVAAPYTGGPPHENCYQFRWRLKETDGANPSWSLEQFTREEAAERGGIEEVAALPTGLILYDMNVFRTMPTPWFYYDYEGDGEPCQECGYRKPGPQAVKASTEDVTQTRDMSLVWYSTDGRKGGRVFINWDAWASHIKPKHCRKPQLMTVDAVAANYRAAVMRNRTIDEQLVAYGTPGRDAQMILADTTPLGPSVEQHTNTVIERVHRDDQI